jgi:hypothetical protein
VVILRRGHERALVLLQLELAEHGARQTRRPDGPAPFGGLGMVMTQGCHGEGRA